MTQTRRIRWTADRKREVVAEILTMQLSRDDAKAKYDLGDDELDAWISAYRESRGAARGLTQKQLNRRRIALQAAT